MADFLTLGAKGQNEYMTVFIEKLGTKYIEKFVGKHQVNLASVITLSAIAAAKMIERDDAKAIEQATMAVYPVMLKRLEELNEISHAQRGELQDQYTRGAGPEVVDALMQMALEVAYKEAGIKKASGYDDGTISKKDRFKKFMSRSGRRDKKKSLKGTSSDGKSTSTDSVSASADGDADFSNDKLDALMSSLNIDPSSPAAAALLGEDE